MKYPFTIIHQEAVENSSMSRIIVGVSEDWEDILVKPWSPFIYKEGGKVIGTDFVSTSIIVLDVDNDPGKVYLSVEGAISLFKDYKHIIGITKSHQKEKSTKAGVVKPPADRYRVILFLSENITEKEQYKQTYMEVLTKFNLIETADILADMARYFIPCTEFTSIMTEGALVTPFKRTEEKEIIKTNFEKGLDTKRTTEIKGRLSSRTVRFLANMRQYPEDNLGWHAKFVAAAFDCKTQGLTFEEAAETLAWASPVKTLDETHDIPQLKDVYEGRISTIPFRVSWPEMSEKAKTKPDPFSIMNLEYLIKEILRYKLYFDSRKNSIRKEPNGENFNDQDLSKVHRDAYGYKILHDKSAIQSALTTIATEDTRDPLKIAIEAETFDPKKDQDYISQLFDTITLSPEIEADRVELYRLMLKRWLIGIVRKIYHPGAENGVLVFVGQQGKGKSRWLAKLASIWFEGYKEGHIDPSNKDHEVSHIHYFLWHVAELDSTTNSKDVGALKDFFTKSTVKIRKAYDKYETEGNSICSFCASVNSVDFLHDTSGNRRYLIIPISKLNPEHDVNIGKVFAQAKYYMDLGERQWFDLEEISLINDNAEEYRFKDPALEILDARIEPGEDLMSVNEILEILEEENKNVRYTKTLAISISNLFFKKDIESVHFKGTKKYKINKSKLKTKQGHALLKKVVDNG